MQACKENILPRRPTLLNTSLGVVLALLIIAAVSGVDLQFQLLRALNPLIEDSRYLWVQLVVTEPSYLIAHAPLRDPVFGWPMCIIILLTIGLRKRFRRAAPILTITAVCLFAYLIIKPTVDSLELHLGLRTMGSPRYFLDNFGDMPMILCNLLVVLLLWRLTRSRVVLIGLLALGILGPALYSWSHSPPSATAFDDESSLAYKLMLFKMDLWKFTDVVVVDETVRFQGNPQPFTFPVVKVQISRYYFIVFNSIALLLLLWPTIYMRIKPNQCTKCDYDRTGIAPDAPCPECGNQPSSSTAANTSTA